MLQSITIPQSLRRICRDILAANVSGKSGVVVGLISTLPHEGVSTISIGLARILAESSRVLLIDASAGRPISDLLGVESHILKAEDLAQLQLANLRDWLVPCPEPNLDLLSIDADQAAATIWDKRWSELKLTMLQHYQVIIVDLGSLQTQLSPFWSACIDQTYVVVDMSSTRVETLQEARKELDILQMPVAGAILNRRPYAVPAFLSNGRS
ncbi:Mrp family chromosome partitioning ATPase [Microvirga lupini]|uniref:Mrp family chromosome partitioning ATPase n=1 Tax=Microvirga lupini TaxID=420324 RepID=A0A7W4VQZ7_9HYPH|nr:hypothetical protein [Microvirga lupini]MBB3021693.1 Mrp family chromosome partitioning ATPase [Microvirga lupini]